MSQPILIVDAFAEEPFSGNPAGVCPLESEPEPAWMQAVAMEMNQAETAFLWPRGEGFGLRWFTPTVEVDLCGHATLASAHVLWSTGRLAPERAARFETASGTLECVRLADGRIEMDFPAEPVAACDGPEGLRAAIGREPLWVGRNRLDWFCLLEDAAAVRAVQPDLAAVAALGLRGTVVTAPAGEGERADFVSRFFAPQSGVPEDAVTGSAHCGLAVLWTERLGRAPLCGYQASRRGGFLEVEHLEERVRLRGRARTALTGSLTV